MIRFLRRSLLVRYFHALRLKAAVVVAGSQATQRPSVSRLWRANDRRRREMSKKRKNRKNHMGSSIDDFLKEEGIFEESQAQAFKEVVAWQLEEAMKKQKISKNRMASMLKTSRTQVDRLLNPKNDITLSSLQRAAMVGRRVMIELV